MNITSSDIILLSHATFGVLGSLAALWVFIEALNGREESAGRMRTAALLGAIAMAAAWILGGYWYVHFYPAEKALILKGPWPFAHNFFMETKEHMVIMLLLLATYFPIVAKNNLARSPDARRLMLCVSGLFAMLALAAEGMGATIAMGVKVGLLGK